MKTFALNLALFFLTASLYACSPAAPATSGTKPPSEKTFLSEAVEIHEAFIAFLDTPTVEKYLALNQVIADNDSFLRSSCSIIDIEQLLVTNEYDNIIAKVSGPDCLAYISTPRYHLLQAVAYRAKGQTSEANSNAAIAFLLADTIMQTGDGTRERPYHVLSVEAEYDVLRLKIKKKRVSQAAEQIDGREMDVLRLASGEEVYFDTTLHWKMLRKELEH